MARRICPRSLLQCSQCLRKQASVIRGVRHYNVSKLSPIQPPPETSPASPLFVPRKMGNHTTRLSNYYDEMVAPNYLLMSYDPSAKSERQLLPLRWDGTSPYHKNRPQPRDNPLPKLRHPISSTNLPQIQSVTVHSMVKSSIQKRSDLLYSALAVQSITGQRPEFIHSYHNVAVFKLRPRTYSFDELTIGIPIAVRSMLKGPPMYSFLSVLTEVVLPRVKDFEGIHFVQNEKNGSINFGFGPSTMSLFPQIEGSSLTNLL
jgi:large subunit ribosomal protein L5